MKLKLAIALLVFQISFAQEKRCGKDEYMKKYLSDPANRKEYEELQKKSQVEYKKIMDEQRSGKASKRATLRIPVAVHYPESPKSTPEADRKCLRDFAQNQVNTLNADFNAKNTDLSKWTAASSFYPGVKIGKIDVEFYIPTKKHPAGTGIAEGTPAVTFGTDYLTGDNSTDSTWAGYMNFIVVNIGGGILGFSPLGGSPKTGRGVVITNNGFASGAGCKGYVPGAPYNLGRTTTHELGHYFDLPHTFEGCNPGDGIDDTPAVATDTGGCPKDGSVKGCVAGKPALTMNYMDYTNDACMYMFTQGQQNVMLAHLNVIKNEFIKDPTLGIGDEVEDLSFSISPVPSKGVINIQFDGLVTDFDVNVYDVAGRPVDYTKNNKSIDLNNVSKGVYFVTISYDNKQTTRKIIIE
jgi:hypothetical protein